jgi:hypothetical protein
MYKPNTKILGTLNNNKFYKNLLVKKMKFVVLIEETLRKS